MTPYAGHVLSDAGDRNWRTGVRWQVGLAIAFGLERTRNERAGDEAAEHEVELRATVRW